MAKFSKITGWTVSELYAFQVGLLWPKGEKSTSFNKDSNDYHTQGGWGVQEAQCQHQPLGSLKQMFGKRDLLIRWIYSMSNYTILQERGGIRSFQVLDKLRVPEWTSKRNLTHMKDKTWMKV